MKCPSCKHSSHNVQDFKDEGFNENIVECKICGTTWSVNHGTAQVIDDTQLCSFLQGFTENVEADDYDYVA